MKTIDEILNELAYTKRIQTSNPINNILKAQPENKFLYKAGLLKKLSSAFEGKNEDLLASLIAICSYDGVDNSFTEIFCKLLKADWHRSHENIIELFESVKDPNSINCIYETALVIRDVDAVRSIAKKSIRTLFAINSPLAIEKIKDFTNSENPAVKEFAIEHLKRINIQH